MKKICLCDSNQASNGTLVVDIRLQKTNERESVLILGDKKDVDKLIENGFESIEKYNKYNQIASFLSNTLSDDEVTLYIENLVSDNDSMAILKEMMIIDYDYINELQWVGDNNNGNYVDMPSTLLIQIRYDVAHMYEKLNNSQTSDDILFFEQECNETINKA